MLEVDSPIQFVRQPHQVERLCGCMIRIYVRLYTDSGVNQVTMRQQRLRNSKWNFLQETVWEGRNSEWGCRWGCWDERQEWELSGGGRSGNDVSSSYSRVSAWCGCEADVSCSLTPWTAKEGESFSTVSLVPAQGGTTLAGPDLGQSLSLVTSRFSFLRKNESGESHEFLSVPSVTWFPTLFLSSLHTEVQAQRGWWVTGARVLCRDPCVFYSRNDLWFLLAF